MLLEIGRRLADNPPPATVRETLDMAFMAELVTSPRLALDGLALDGLALDGLAVDELAFGSNNSFSVGVVTEGIACHPI